MDILGKALPGGQFRNATARLAGRAGQVSVYLASTMRGGK
jgi:hypothetical protein